MPESGKSSSRLTGIELAYVLATLGCVLSSYFFVLGDRMHFLSHTHYFPLLDIFPAWFLFLNGLTASLNIRNRRISTRRFESFMSKKGSILFLTGLLFCPVWPLNMFMISGLLYMAAPYLIRFNSSILKVLASFTAIISIVLISFTSLEPTINYSWIKLEGFGWRELASFTLYNGYYSVLPWSLFFLLGIIHGRGDVRVRDLFLPSNIVAVVTIGLSLIAQHMSTGFYMEQTDVYTSRYFPLNMKLYIPAFLLLGAGAVTLLTNTCIYVLKKVDNKKLIDYISNLSSMKFSIFLFHLVLGTLTMAIFKLSAFNDKFYLALYILALMSIIWWLIFFWRRRINSLGPIEWLNKRIAGSGRK